MQYIERVHVVSLSQLKWTIELHWHFNCDTRNLLYALTCPTCGLNYIGQTERTVRERNGDYRRAISDPKFHTQGVHKHLATCGKGHFIMTPFFKIKSADRGHQLILQYESHFIRRYKPALNESKLNWSIFSDSVFCWWPPAIVLTLTWVCQFIDKRTPKIGSHSHHSFISVLLRTDLLYGWTYKNFMILCDCHNLFNTIFFLLFCCIRSSLMSFTRNM